MARLMGWSGAGLANGLCVFAMPEPGKREPVPESLCLSGACLGGGSFNEIRLHWTGLDWCAVL